MIDLHIHSKYSLDGSEEVCNILSMAEELGLKCISITDHECCKAYDDLKDKSIRNIFSGEIVTGVELYTKVLGIHIEILGYNIMPQKMQKLIDKLYLTPQERLMAEASRFYKKLVDNGVILSGDVLNNYDCKEYFSRYIHRHIIMNDNNKKYFSDSAWNNSEAFYREYMSNPNSFCYISVEDLTPDFDDVYRIVKDAGGMVFLPHIYEYRENSMKILDYILKNYKIDGIECYYRNFTNEQTEYLLNVCKKYNLYMSGGSDFHGEIRPLVKLGTGEGKLNVPNNIIDKWKRVLI